MVLPVPEIDPALALQVTPVFDVPETVATKVCEPLVETLVALGEMVTETPAGPEGETVDFIPVLPQAASRQTIAANMARPNHCRITSALIMNDFCCRLLRPRATAIMKILDWNLEKKDLRQFTLPDTDVHVLEQ